MVKIEALGKAVRAGRPVANRRTFPESVLALLQDEQIQEKAGEVARFFFTNGSVTINLLPILTFTFLAALLAIPLLLPAYDALSGLYSNAAGYSNNVAYSGTNYGPPTSGFGYSARSSLVGWE